jgi:hypothetical protein
MVVVGCLLTLWFFSAFFIWMAAKPYHTRRWRNEKPSSGAGILVWLGFVCSFWGSSFLFKWGMTVIQVLGWIAIWLVGLRIVFLLGFTYGDKVGTVIEKFFKWIGAISLKSWLTIVAMLLVIQLLLAF